jgi:amino acid permease
MFMSKNSRKTTLNSLSQEIKKQIVKQSEVQNIKKLGPWGTYFSTLKGFVAIGLLYMPKNTLNGGWGFTIFAMLFSFFVTYYCVIKLVEARDKIPGGPSYSEICEVTMGKTGKYVVDVFIFVMQLGFVIGLSYFAITSMKSVVEGIFKVNPPIVYVGKPLIF